VHNEDVTHRTCEVALSSRQPEAGVLCGTSYTKHQERYESTGQLRAARMIKGLENVRKGREN